MKDKKRNFVHKIFFCIERYIKYFYCVQNFFFFIFQSFARSIFFWPWFMKFIIVPPRYRSSCTKRRQRRWRLVGDNYNIIKKLVFIKSIVQIPRYNLITENSVCMLLQMYDRVQIVVCLSILIVSRDHTLSAWPWPWRQSDRERKGAHDHRERSERSKRRRTNTNKKNRNSTSGSGRRRRRRTTD